MYQCFKPNKAVINHSAAIDAGNHFKTAMDAGDHFKNGASLKNFRFLLKNVVTIVACFAVCIMFSGCPPDDELGKDADFEAFTFAGVVDGSVSIKTDDRTITAEATTTTNLETIVPVFVVSKGATVSVAGKPQKSGETQNSFKNPVEYVVISEDAKTNKTWIVNIANKPSLTITLLSDGEIYCIGDWVDFEVKGNINNQGVEVWVSCLVGKPQHTKNDEPLRNGVIGDFSGKPIKFNPYPRIEKENTFTFSPETFENWVNSWAKIIAQDKQSGIWSEPVYVQICPTEILGADGGVLINGVKWSTRNVNVPGTFAIKPEKAGMFYQWNRNIGWSATDPLSSSPSGRSWNSSNPTGTTWDKTNDPSPAGWRVPTLNEIQKLLDADKVSFVWTTKNGVYGGKFTDKASGESIFLPAVGYRNNSTLDLVGLVGAYWSSTQFNSTTAYDLDFFDNKASVLNLLRTNGRCVRSVKEN